MSLEERFWAKVAKGDGCWLWTAGTNNHGYGRISVGGHPVFAHRVSWELHFGPIPDGLFVCHRCDNPPCVQPHHLYIGTAADNQGDMARKGRAGRVQGERSGMAKLTDAQVAEIAARAVGGETFQVLAAEYGVHSGHISRILSGKRRQIGAVQLPSRIKATPQMQAEMHRLWAAGINQSEIGRRLGFASGTVSRIVRGVYNLPKSEAPS